MFKHLEVILHFALLIYFPSNLTDIKIQTSSCCVRIVLVLNHNKLNVQLKKKYEHIGEMFNLICSALRTLVKMPNRSVTNKTHLNVLVLKLHDFSMQMHENARSFWLFTIFFYRPEVTFPKMPKSLNLIGFEFTWIQ